MSQGLFRHLRDQWIGCLALFLVLTGGVAWAAFDPVGADGDIDACFKKRSGDLRLLKGDNCARGEKPVAWNQDGPAGAQGSQGAQGAVGPQGPAGSPDTPQQVLDKLLQVDGAGSGLDAATLGGVAPGGLVHGLGEVIVNRQVIVIDDVNTNFLTVPGLGRVTISCGDPTSSIASFQNTSGSTLQLWEMYDGGAPTFVSLANNGIRNAPTSAAIDDPARVQWEVGQGSGTAGEMATIIVDIFNAPNASQTECHFQAMAISGRTG